MCINILVQSFTTLPIILNILKELLQLLDLRLVNFSVIQYFKDFTVLANNHLQLTTFVQCPFFFHSFQSFIQKIKLIQCPPQCAVPSSVPNSPALVECRVIIAPSLSSIFNKLEPLRFSISKPQNVLKLYVHYLEISYDQLWFSVLKLCAKLINQIVRRYQIQAKDHRDINSIIVVLC